MVFENSSKAKSDYSPEKFKDLVKKKDMKLS